MELNKFKSKINEIIYETENTNYGSILAQLKLVILVQELILLKTANETEILKVFWDVSGENDFYEARLESIGEINSNLRRSSGLVCIFDDFGEDYISNLFQILNILIKNKKLLKECNT